MAEVAPPSAGPNCLGVEGHNDALGMHACLQWFIHAMNLPAYSSKSIYGGLAGRISRQGAKEVRCAATGARSSVVHPYNRRPPTSRLCTTVRSVLASPPRTEGKNTAPISCDYQLRKKASGTVEKKEQLLARESNSDLNRDKVAY